MIIQARFYIDFKFNLEDIHIHEDGVKTDKKITEDEWVKMAFKDKQKVIKDHAQMSSDYGVDFLAYPMPKSTEQ